MVEVDVSCGNTCDAWSIPQKITLPIIPRVGDSIRVRGGTYFVARVVLSDGEELVEIVLT